METNVSYTIVGAFVIGLLAIIVFCIIWISSGLSFETYRTYLVYMQESVSGLSYDAPVEYNGVNVGTVSQIDLNPNNPQLVKILLRVKSTTPITRGTVATLNTRGLTGVAYIALKDKSTDLRPLERLPNQPYPVIPNAPSIFMRLDAALSEITRNVREVAFSIQALLDKDNREAFKKILFNMRDFSEVLARNGDNINQIMTNMSRGTKQLSPFFQSGRNTLRAIETQTIPATYQMLRNLDDASRTISEIAQDLKENPSMLIRGIDRQPLGPGESR